MKQAAKNGLNSNTLTNKEKLMAKKEVLTDLWVYEMLKEANIDLHPQGSNITEINNALKSASKAGSGNVGFPEYCGVVKDFILIIENKSDVSLHTKRNEKNVICTQVASVKNYAVNGALFYGKHLAKNTSYKKIIAFGVSGNEKRHRITPVFIDERGGYKELDDVETFTLFNEKNIDEYYTKSILKEKTPEEKTTEEILKDARALHEDLRNYGSIQDKDKPLVVSGILLALREMEHKGFSIESLVGDQTNTDGEKIYEAIEKNLKRANVSPQVKKDKLLSQFLVIKDTKVINEVNDNLKKSPLKHFTEFLYENIYKNIKYIHSAEDYLGRFYGEFMSYSGGDGQSLGIVLTPKHITELFCELADLKVTDSILDPCCGTAGFLIAGMHDMLQKTDNPETQRKIRKNQLHGLELQPYMFTISTTNMILRGDGKSNLEQEDFLKCNPSQLQEKGCTVGMMNPPYSMGSKNDPSLYEINFTEHLLNSIVQDGKVIVIVPQSSMTGKTLEEQAIKANILKHHTLEGVITLNSNSFYGVGTNPCIALFTAGVPHYKEKKVKFINFEKDGFEVQKHRGLVETIDAIDKRQHLLDVWFDRIEAETMFCVNTTIEPEDEWLHSFYFFNDENPTKEEFEKTIADYLTFEFNMILQGKEYLFDSKRLEIVKDFEEVEDLDKKAYGEFYLKEIFTKVQRGKRLKKLDHKKGKMPYVSSSAMNNGIDGFVSNSENVRIFKNCLTIANSGSVGATFFQPFEFVASDHVTKLQNDDFNEFIYLYIASVIKRLSEKYSFNREINDQRIKREKILLPIDENGRPDFKYMENFIKKLEYEKLTNYIEKKVTNV
ncbi:N-6 DNA methylase [Flectobacillus major]|uniref:N-6 DNA methylase n=1 Tax=Flectobacillus major TaxID=103 RepID=UPI0004005443|nr:N-6 DNA methylase [Flectobacillus major]